MGYGWQSLITWSSKAEPTGNQSLHKGCCLTDITGGTELTKRNNYDANNLQKQTDLQHFHHCLLVLQTATKNALKTHRRPSRWAAGFGSPGLRGEPHAIADGW